MRWTNGWAALAGLAGMAGAPKVAAEEAPQALKVMTWNLHHGEGGDGKLDLARIAAVIRAQKPDLVALQEVDKNCRRSGSVDQAAELARLTGLHGAFGKAMDHDGGEYGQAILAREPLGGTKVIRLPSQGEPRIAFQATVTVGGRTVTMVSAHLDHKAPEFRQRQSEALRDAFQAAIGPGILAGDFNDEAASPTVAALERGWDRVVKKAPAATCPADRPEVEIDEIYLRGGFEAVAPAEVLAESVASDHRPVVVSIRSAEPRPVDP